LLIVVIEKAIVLHRALLFLPGKSRVRAPARGAKFSNSVPGMWDPRARDINAEFEIGRGQKLTIHRVRL
jgi:hypothetical protein